MVSSSVSLAVEAEAAVKAAYDHDGPGLYMLWSTLTCEYQP